MLLGSRASSDSKQPPTASYYAASGLLQTIGTLPRGDLPPQTREELQKSLIPRFMTSIRRNRPKSSNSRTAFQSMGFSSVRDGMQVVSQLACRNI